MSKPVGAKTAHGKERPEYVRNPDRSRDPPTAQELATLDRPGRRGIKIWRKAREGKL